MAGGIGDVRKVFIFTTTQNYFGLMSEPWDQPLLYNSVEINNFLDDGNQMLLRVQRSNSRLSLSNTIDVGDTKDKVLVFFKLRPEVITDENLHNNILVSSMLESPINSLYQAVRQVFAPVLLKDQEWSQNFDPKLQNLLSELEAGLGIVLRRSDTHLSKLKVKEDDTRGILTPSDEFQFWIEQADRGNKQISKERASYFKELFETVAREFYNLDNLSLLEVVDLVETTRDVVDDVWRQTEHDHYPESRMLHLLDIIGGSFGRFVQKKLGALNLWEDPYYLVKENLKAGISICEQWVMVCTHLTGQVWQRYVPHPWKSERYFPETLDKLGKRLEEVLAVRTIHEKLLYFLPASEETIVCLARVFEPFTGLNPVQYNPYTEPLWKAAVSQYEKIIAPAEQKIAGKLKNYISEIQDSPQQLLQAFLKYKELVKRPTISKGLMLERETLLTRLVDSVKDFRLDFESRCRGIPGDASGPLSGRNLSEVVNNIVWVRQLELKVDDMIKIAEALLSDLSGFRSFHRSAEDLLDQLKLYEQEQFDDWSREIQSGLSDSRSGLCIEANSRIMELDPRDGSLKVHYSDRLVILLREVRQLSALGFVIPAKIQQVANIAQKFCKQAIILKQVAHFYNSIDQQMIQSQRPMMLQSALAFEQIIKNSKAGSGGKSQITWDNPKELEGYIQKLQNAAERLATENRKLRKWHTTFCEKVVVLMNIDLLRQQQRWKDGLQELRTGLASVEAQGFQASDMRAWKQHWNHQLYKALEHQYQMGLEALNENLPEINIELTYKQGRLQFRPPFEEIRAKYYREMKRFISIPNQFKGVGEAGDESIFSIMIDRNASGFLTIFSKAEDLFRRLAAVLHQHKEWIVIGQVDMEALVEKHLFTVHDWEKNFKALKVKGKEVERLPSMVKVDCLNINCNPVKTVIDDLIQKLFDMLVVSLKKSIQAHLHEIDTFVTEAMEALTVMPQSVEEIGDANLQYSKLQERKPEEAALPKHPFSAVQQQQRKWLEELNKQIEGDQQRKIEEKMISSKGEEHDRWAMHFDSLKSYPGSQSRLSSRSTHRPPEYLSVSPDTPELADVNSVCTPVTGSQADPSKEAHVEKPHRDVAMRNTQKTNFLRSMTALLDPAEIEERDRRRQKQLEHQKAITAQVEERRRKKQLEEEQRKKEELLEELRLAREREEMQKQYEEDVLRQKQKEEIKTLKTNELFQTMQRAQELAQRLKQEQRIRELAQKGHDTSRLTKNLGVDTKQSECNTATSSISNLRPDLDEASGTVNTCVSPATSPRKDIAVQTEDLTTRIFTKAESYCESVTEREVSTCSSPEISTGFNRQLKKNKQELSQHKGPNLESSWHKDECNQLTKTEKLKYTNKCPKRPAWNINKPLKRYIPASEKYPKQLQKQREEKKVRRQMELLHLVERNNPGHLSQNQAGAPAHELHQERQSRIRRRLGRKEAEPLNMDAFIKERSVSSPVPAVRNRSQHTQTGTLHLVRSSSYEKENVISGSQTEASSGVSEPSLFIPYVRTNEVYYLDPDAPLSRPSTQDLQYESAKRSDQDQRQLFDCDVRDPLLNPNLVKHRDRQQAILKGLSELRQGLLQKQKELESNLMPSASNPEEF